MYTLIQVFENLPSDIYIQNKVIYYKNEGYILSKDELSNENIIYFSNNPYVVERVIEDKIYLRNVNQVILLKNSQEIANIPIVFSGAIQVKFIDENLIVFRNCQSDKWDIKAIDKQGNLLWIAKIEESVNIKVSGNDLIFHHFTEALLSCHSLNTGEEKWRIDLSSIMKYEDLKIYGDIHEIKGKLYCCVAEKYASKSATLCIDIETGILIKKLDNFSGWLYLANERFYTINFAKIIVLNPLTFDIEEIDISHIIQEHNWEIAYSKCAIKEHLFYFSTLNIGSHTAPYVGVIDMQERKLLWSQAIEVEQSWQSVSELRVEDKRLYVLTHDNTLHIFEEDSM